MEHTDKPRLRRGVASLVTAALLAAGAVVGISAPAQAAGDVEYGIGLGGEGGVQPHQLHGGGPNKNPANWHGSYYVPGVGYMYCLNAGLGEGYSNDPGGEVNSFRKQYTTNIGSMADTWQDVNLGPAETFKINYAIQKFGQTTHDRNAPYSLDQAYWGAAVEMYIWSITNPNLTGPGQNGWSLYHTRFDAGQQAEVATRINMIAAAANSATPSSGGGSGSVAINMTNYHEGVAVVSMTPADSSATLTITGGTFPGGMTTISGVTNGQSIPVYGNAVVDPANPSKQYSIRISGSAIGTGEGITDKIRVAHNGDKQDMVTTSANVPVTFNLSSGVADPLIEFSPLIRTEAPEYIRVGESFTDSVIASVEDEIDSPWATYTDGSYVTVKANGTLYGPLLERPTESSTVPAGTPVAGTATVDLNGPGTYTATADTATESGYYTWVWNIDSADQGTVARMLLPQGYSFTDNYGQAVETTYAPMRPTVTSQVEQAVVNTGDVVRDTITVTNEDGPWMTGADALFEGTAYAVTSGSAPQRGALVPNSNARIIDTVRMTINEPGTYTSPEVTVPDDAGYVVWVWRFASWYQEEPTLWMPNYQFADEWAMPSETQRVRFSPALTTQVSSEFVQPGETFNDRVTAFAAKGQWTGNTSIRANGTLYGPFADRPAESDTAPEGAPVAGTAILALNGPGTYETDSDIVAQESGYYTWVWNIDYNEQSSISKDYIPSGYSFTDRFAQVVETSVAPMQVGGVSEVVDAEVALDQGFQDALDVSVSEASRNWIMIDGQRIPVTYRGTAYFVPGTEAPAQSAEVPAGTEVVGTTTITASSPGLYESEVLPGEDYREGYTTWVWEVRKEDQPAQYRDYILEWSDDFGIPAETTKVVLPKITTQAQTDVPVGDTFHDVATVTGPIPVGGADVHFELYAATQDEAGNWVCEAGNLLWTSTSQTITSEGKYTSPEAPYQSVGDYHWVEVLTSNDGNEISRGICGLPEETTTVVEPEVTTKAQPFSALGAETGIFDVATVTGPIAKNGYDLTFEAYKVPYVKDETTGEWVIDAPEGTEEGDLSWVCSSEPVFTTDENLHVPAEGEYTSQSFVPEGYGKYLWVETLSYNPAEGEEGESILIHRGECGIRLETSFVVDITTQAQPTAKGGDTITDTAIVNGFIPEDSTIEFAAYKVPLDAPQYGSSTEEITVCTEDALLGVTEPVEIPEGLHEGLEIVSAGITVPDTINQNYKVYWIETSRDGFGNVIAQGKCGLPSETTTVESSKGALAWTGGFNDSALYGGAALLMALFAAAGVYVMRRRQEA